LKGGNFLMKKIFFAALFFVLFSSPALAAPRVKGQTLKPGDCIGIITPGSYAQKKDFEAVELLKAHGYKVKIAPAAKSVYGHFAGSDRKRAEDINNFFKDDEVKAILCTRGGYGCARVLDKLDYKMIAKHPKMLIGFSDVTALHIAIGERCGLSTVHGPMLVSFTRENFKSEYTTENFFKGLENGFSGEIPMPEGQELKSVINGRAEGIIMGGNLTLLAALAGTPYELNGKGALLLIEEVGESPYRIDRMMNQLYQSGLLKRVNGILYGDFVGCKDPDPDGIEDFTVEQVLKYYARLSGKPVIKNVPAGHGKFNAFIPLGVHAVMEANDKKSSIFIQ